MKPSVSAGHLPRSNGSEGSEEFQSSVARPSGGPAATPAGVEASSAYNAASIKILSAEEVEARFDWSAAGRLAEEYRKDRKFIERGLAACRNAGHPDGSYFIRRYLMGDKAVPVNPEVDAAFRELFMVR